MKKSFSKRVNVLIPNATSPKNPGDQAILSVLLRLLKQKHPNASIIVHSVDPHLYPKSRVLVKHTLYSWSVFQDRRLVSQILRLLNLVIHYVFVRIGHPIHNSQITNLIQDYEQADLIVFVGGGYLHAKKGITQSLNLVMQLVMFVFASAFPAKKVVGPVSVGPFAYDWQRALVLKVLQTVEIVALREEYSYQMLKKHRMKNIVRSADHALFVQKKSRQKSHRNKRTIGFTIREWLQTAGQSNIESSLSSALARFAKLTNANIQPIIQVDAPEYGEDDTKATMSISRLLQNNDVQVLPVKKIHTLNESMDLYARLDLVVGMRMHSNILAATQGTPFAAISYEPKTEGIANQLGMKKYCISCEKISSEHLYRMIVNAYKNRGIIRKKLQQRIGVLEKQETNRWEQYLSL